MTHKKRIAFNRIKAVIYDYFEDMQGASDDCALKVRYQQKDIENIKVYEKWAISEILEYINKSDKRTIDAVEEFRDKMDDYACKGNYIFSIAYDTATCVLDALIYAGYH